MAGPPQTRPIRRITDLQRSAFGIYGVTAMLMREPMGLIVRHTSEVGYGNWQVRLEWLRVAVILLLLSRLFLISRLYFEQVFMQPDSADWYRRRSYPSTFYQVCCNSSGRGKRCRLRRSGGAGRSGGFPSGLNRECAGLAISGLDSPHRNFPQRHRAAFPRCFKSYPVFWILRVEITAMTLFSATGSVLPCGRRRIRRRSSSDAAGE